MFPTIGAVVVLFVASMVCVVGTCAVVKHFRTGYLNEQLIELRAKSYLSSATAPTKEDKHREALVKQQIQASGAPVDFGLGAIVVLFVASMICIFLGRNSSPMTSSVSAYQSPVVRYVDEGSAVSDEVYKAPERYGTTNTPRPHKEEGSGT
jgi:hypothetical protein